MLVAVLVDGGHVLSQLFVVSWRRFVNQHEDEVESGEESGRQVDVLVGGSVWMQELQFLKKDIITSLNELIEEDLVQDIKFKIGAL